MHELSIASAIVERARAVSDANGSARVIKIGLRVGEISGVEVDALRFGFSALCRDTAMAATELEVELCRRRQRCAACGLEYEPADLYSTACPSCGSDESLCVAGKELDVTFIELEDGHEGQAG